ncbi:MAG: hypothetical protein ACFFEY_20075 [Candidatus Thorarchaeota archaeon]
MDRRFPDSLIYTRDAKEQIKGVTLDILFFIGLNRHLSVKKWKKLTAFFLFNKWFLQLITQ